MRVYLAGEMALTKDISWGSSIESWQQNALTSRIKRRLYSYFYHGFKQGNKLDREVSLARDAGMDLFLDSGAYSAFTQGGKIPLERYADFIQKHGSIFNVRANLDDIGDTGPKSWENLKALESLGCQVFPVFHHADEERFLVKMLDEGYTFLALGGLVGSSRRILQEWLDHVWAKYLTHPDGTARVQVHGFGLTDQELVQRYPWFSVDSSAWLFTGMMGSCLFRRGTRFQKVIFSSDSPDAKNLNGWHYDNLPEAQRTEVDSWLVEHDVTAKQLASHYSFRHLVNAKTYQEMELLGTNKFTLQQETLF